MIKTLRPPQPPTTATRTNCINIPFTAVASSRRLCPGPPPANRSYRSPGHHCQLGERRGVTPHKRNAVRGKEEKQQQQRNIKLRRSHNSTRPIFIGECYGQKRKKNKIKKHIRHEKESEKERERKRKRQRDVIRVCVSGRGERTDKQQNTRQLFVGFLHIYTLAYVTTKQTKKLLVKKIFYFSVIENKKYVL